MNDPRTVPAITVKIADTTGLWDWLAERRWIQHRDYWWSTDDIICFFPTDRERAMLFKLTWGGK